MTDSSMKDFEIVKVLGKGSFGSVYLVRRKEDKKIYALKSVILEKLNKKEQQNSVNEVRILASVNHPNVIGYKEAFWDDNQNTLNIVMEYADDGDLQTKIIKMRKEGGMFKEDLIWSYSIQMIEGLKSLHDKKIMHRDLKSANIFLVKDKHQCKLGDMNVSKVIKEKELLTQTGTPYYASPEVWRDEPYSYKSDLWSIGCVIYELCALRPPFKGKDLDELFVNVCKGKMDRINHVYSDNLWKMIKMLLQVDVDKRCDCDNFLNSKLITKKIQEMKNENKDYKNLEINKKINDGKLLDTIRFDNIMDIKRQLPTKKNYSNENAFLGSDKFEKIKKKNVDLNANKERKNENNKSNKKLEINNVIETSNTLKYQKIKDKNKKIVYKNKNVRIISKHKEPIKTEIKKEKDNIKKIEKLKENKLGCIFIDLAESHLKKVPNSQIPQEKDNSIINLDNKINSTVKASISKKNKILKNSPKISENGRSMIYQKPKLYENSAKRDKKNICLVNKPMTTKRTVKKMNFIDRDITPKRDKNEIKNKSQHISSMKDMNILSKLNKHYKNGYASVNREKIQKKIAKPIETSPGGNNNTKLNKSNPGIYLNILKKKNDSKKIKNNINQRAQSTISKKREKSNNYNLPEKNIIQEFSVNKEADINNINNNKKFISNRENMVNMLINNYNKKNNFNTYNENNSINKNNYMEKPLIKNNTNNYIKKPIIDATQFENKNLKKLLYPNNKIKLREKKNFTKKRIINNNLIERDLTEPELLKMINPIRIDEQKREYQRTLNISLNNQEQNSFLQKQKAHKMIRFNTNNNSRYNQNYSNNTNQNNPQIFNNYVSINNLVTPNFPVKIINIFGQ